MIINWINSGQSRLTCQIRNFDHETMIAPHIKQIKTDYEFQFSINSMLKKEIN